MSFSVQFWPRWLPRAAMICFFQSSPVLFWISKFDINYYLISELPANYTGVGQKIIGPAPAGLDSAGLFKKIFIQEFEY